MTSVTVLTHIRPDQHIRKKISSIYANKPVIGGCIPERKSLSKIRGYKINITLGKITSIITVVNAGITHQQYIGGMIGTVPVIVGVG